MFVVCTECDRPSHQIPNTAMIVRSAIAITHQERSPFVVSDERSPKTKERSPFTPNTKQYDDSTKIDRPLLFPMTDRLK
ncbi:MAG: hypothetical protein JGK12_09030 [Microcoleus sp. PH2017_01_SCD_O_A]|uniref:hypothetical protein n=2 Tax=unclassified Microcoleus TaxID=2642155 RepID=UPI001D2F12DF|nr:MULTISPECIES: hypothetical protein [unclassified Microcoleus]MCC3416607.1 hypothetical protein [Microcoleus sp. PH2017_07_MST_O_A]MCC3424062.1 hypothetical protein [Microcoleus sp. PH2017_01_SCD_O_A]MCC3591191.1 hypothetical protein [Microcoleus sp. PH2017_28_MFU_U_A]